MGEYREVVAGALAALPAAVPEVAVLVASDEVVELLGPAPYTIEARGRAAAAVRAMRFQGGCDNTRALSRAWDIAAGGERGAVLWLHATQPVEFGGVEGLRQKWERRPGEPAMISVQFGAGPNCVLRSLAGIEAVGNGLRSGIAADDLDRLCDLWAGRAAAMRFERAREREDEGGSGEREGSFHVVRLWAQDEILRLAGSRADADRARALELAGTYHLVTPVSGAVVLETADQYRDAGLEPVPASSVPIVPEPETWMLMIVGFLVVAGATALRRRVVRVRA